MPEKKIMLSKLNWFAMGLFCLFGLVGTAYAALDRTNSLGPSSDTVPDYLTGEFPEDDENWEEAWEKSGLQYDSDWCSRGQVRDNGVCVACSSKPLVAEYLRGARKYCVGGRVTVQYANNIIQQFRDCPPGAQPNADLTNCECIYKSGNTDCNNVKLTEEQLKCGPGGCNSKPLHKRCWTKTSQKAYKTCMGF